MESSAYCLWCLFIQDPHQVSEHIFTELQAFETDDNAQPIVSQTLTGSNQPYSVCPLHRANLDVSMLFMRPYHLLWLTQPVVTQRALELHDDHEQSSIVQTIVADVVIDGRRLQVVSHGHPSSRSEPLPRGVELAGPSALAPGTFDPTVWGVAPAHVRDAESPWPCPGLTIEGFDNLDRALNTHSPSAPAINDHASNDEFDHGYTYAREVATLEPVLMQGSHLNTSLQGDVVDSTREIGAGAIGSITGLEIRRAIPTHPDIASPPINEVEVGTSTAAEVSVFSMRAYAVSRLLTCTQNTSYRYAPLSLAWLFSETYGCPIDHAPFVLKTASPSPPAMQVLQQNVH